MTGASYQKLLNPTPQWTSVKSWFEKRIICYRWFPLASLLVSPTIIQSVRVTHAASSFSPSFLTFDADACGSYFLYPLLDVFSSRPIGAINAEVPGVRVFSLSTYNFHRSEPPVGEMSCDPAKKSFCARSRKSDAYRKWLCFFISVCSKSCPKRYRSVSKLTQHQGKPEVSH